MFETKLTYLVTKLIVNMPNLATKTNLISDKKYS